MDDDVARYVRELQADPALLDAIMARPDVFPSASVDLERVTIQTDVASVDAAVTRALAVTVEGAEAKLELENR